MLNCMAKLKFDSAFIMGLLVCFALPLKAEVTASIPGCGSTACDNSGSGSALWPSPSNFSLCNNTVNPLTLIGWRFKTPSWGGYGSNGGGTFTVSGSGPYTYQKKVPLWDQIRPPASCLTTHDVSGSIGAFANGQPYDWDVLLKTGSCNPPNPLKTPTPVTCAQVAAIRGGASYYAATCIPDTLGGNGGVDSGGLIDTFVNQGSGVAQTQIQIGIPTNTWSESTTTVTFDPYASMGNSPLYLMATAMGQEYFNLDMQFLFGIGSKESFAGMKQVPGSALFIPTNAAGVAGTYHVESFTFATIVAGYPSFFPAYACMAGYPNVTTALGTSCAPSANDPLYFYMSQNSGSPLINNNSAELVNSVLGGGFNFYRLYDALVASTDLCFLNLLENGADDEAAVKLLPAGYNLGWNSSWINSLPAGAPMLAASDISAYTVMGNSNYRDEVLRTAHNLEAASACPMAGGVYDPPILLSDLQTFFFGNGGTAAAQGSGGLLLHFSLSASQRTALWNDVTCAFNALKGLAPGRAANEVSFRYDFLTILRVAKQYLTTTRPYPTQSDFTSWVDSHSSGGSACGTAIDTTFPFITGVTPSQNSNVCPDFLVNFNTTDETALDKVEFSLDPDWLAWTPAVHGAGSAYSFNAPGSDAHFPASGPGKLWIRSTDTCGNSTIRQLNFNVNCGTPTFTVTPSRTASPSPTRSATPSATPSRTETPSFTISPSPSATRTVTPLASTATSTVTLTPSASSTAAQSHTSTITATGSPTYSATPSRTAVNTATITLSHTPSQTPNGSFTETVTSTVTPSRTATLTPAPPSATSTISPSATSSPTSTGTRTRTGTATVTATSSFTGTVTPTATQTPYYSPTESPTITLTGTRPAVVDQDKLIMVRGIYPNPFSDRVKVYYTLRADAKVEMQIYNVAGEPIQMIPQDGLAGVNQLVWDGISSQGGRCASGVYVLHLKAEAVDNTRDGFWDTAVIAR
jgi:hypothetical protein